MAGSWKHGWIPLTPGAVISKNHGRKPGGGSKLGTKLSGMQSSGSKPKPGARASDAGLKEMTKTPAGRRKEILRRQPKPGKTPPPAAPRKPETPSEARARLDRMVKEDNERRRTDPDYAEYHRLRSQGLRATREAYELSQKYMKALMEDPDNGAKIQRLKKARDEAVKRKLDLDRRRDAAMARSKERQRQKPHSKTALTKGRR